MDDAVLRTFDGWLSGTATLLLACLLVGTVAVLAGWLAASACLAAASHLPGALGRVSARAARRFTPAFVARALAATVGLTIATAGAAAASSGQGGGPAVPLLDRPAGTAVGPSAAPAPHAPPAPSEPVEVVVAPGDSLWDIAARSLAPHSSAASIAASWPRWYDANRAVIGPDPDLIHPGQRLEAPPGG